MKTDIDINFKSLLGTDYREKTVITPEEEKKLEALEEATPASVWAVRHDSYSAVQGTVKKIPPGNYDVIPTLSGYILVKSELNTDELITLPDEASDVVVAHIKEFWDLKPSFDAHKFLHKRGILLYGPQGGGKTSALNQVTKYFIEEVKGIVLQCESPYELSGGINMVRSVQPDLPIVCILEDLDTMIAYYGDKKLTAVLDGQGNTSGVLFLATTNFPERLPKRIVNRPSRFDVVKYVGVPSAAARLVYLQHKMPDLDATELARWVEKTADFTIPQIKEIIILVRGYLKSLDEAISQLADLKTPKSSGKFEEV